MLPVSGHHGQDTITSTVIGAKGHTTEPEHHAAPGPTRTPVNANKPIASPPTTAHPIASPIASAPVSHPIDRITDPKKTDPTRPASPTHGAGPVHRGGPPTRSQPVHRPVHHGPIIRKPPPLRHGGDPPLLPPHRGKPGKPGKPGAPGAPGAPGGSGSDPLGPQESEVPAIVNTQPTDGSSSSSSGPSGAVLFGILIVAGVAIYWFMRHKKGAGAGEKKGEHKAEHKPAEHHKADDKKD